MATKRDYYEVLGVAKNATSDEVKAAYKRLAKQYHPDVSTEQKAKEKFQEVLEAYTILSDAQKRQNYDQFGHAAQGFQGYSGGQGFEGFGTSGIDFDFADLFENLSGFGFEDFGFGGPRKATRRQNGQNLRVDVTLSFEDAVFGATQKINLEHIADCGSCNGTGAKNGEVQTCSTCKGSGVVMQMRRMPFGVFQSQSTCGKCGGNGRVAKESCLMCKGTGHRNVKQNVEVKIPAGIETGMHLRLQGL
ncbi:MAG: DnaJ domain-containing protein, partial [Candidatus Diapherotrites archaeon]|nr:DnaJ domain-containing protein [Candidatus Diapherotrites archaeon]